MVKKVEWAFEKKNRLIRFPKQLNYNGNNMFCFKNTTIIIPPLAKMKQPDPVFF